MRGEGPPAPGKPSDDCTTSWHLNFTRPPETEPPSWVTLSSCEIINGGCCFRLPRCAEIGTQGLITAMAADLFEATLFGLHALVSPLCLTPPIIWHIGSHSSHRSMCVSYSFSLLTSYLPLTVWHYPSLCFHSTCILERTFFSNSGISVISPKWLRNLLAHKEKKFITESS